MQYVVPVGELLLALHFGVGAGQYDPAVHRDPRLPGVPVSGLSVAIGIDRADDHGAQSRGA